MSVANAGGTGSSGLPSNLSVTNDLPSLKISTVTDLESSGEVPDTIVPPSPTAAGCAFPGYPAVSNNGTIALTDRRLIFVTLTGKIIDIPRAEITGVREVRVFKTSVRGSRSHLIVQIPTGEIAFYVSSNADWINTITSLRAK
jgi:hypothetical protein